MPARFDALVEEGLQKRVSLDPLELVEPGSELDSKQPRVGQGCPPNFSPGSKDLFHVRFVLESSTLFDSYRLPTSASLAGPNSGSGIFNVFRATRGSEFFEEFEKGAEVEWNAVESFAVSEVPFPAAFPLYM